MSNAELGITGQAAVDARAGVYFRSRHRPPIQRNNLIIQRDASTGCASRGRLGGRRRGSSRAGRVVPGDRGEGPIAAAELRSRKARQLLKLLAVERPRLVPVDYDLVTTFDCLPDMGDPLSAANQVRQAFGRDGTWLIVEPAAGDSVAENMNPVGRIYYNFSTLLGVPNALSRPGGYALGAQAGEAAIRRVVTDAGFTRFRRATETRFNIVFEARP
jgi:hypothetical protein